MIDSVAELLGRLAEELSRAQTESDRARVMITLEVVQDLIERDGFSVQDYINQLDTRG